MNGPWIRRRLLLWIPPLVAFLLYLPTLRGGFVWDDPLFLVDPPIYRDPARWAEALARPFLLSPNYYRPLALLTFLVELRLFGLTPWAFHLTNVLLHTLNTALLTFLAWALIRPSGEEEGRLLPALTAGLAYAAHPALVEGVSFISSRFDLLMTALLLGTLWIDLRRPDRSPGTLALLALGTGAAFLAKEMAVGFLAVYPLWRWTLRRWGRVDEGLRDLALRWGTVAAGLGIALLLRFLALGYLLRPDARATLAAGPPLSHLLLVARSLVEYLKVTLWPFTSLTPLHYADLPLEPTLPAWISLLLALAVLAGLLVALRRNHPAAWMGLAALAALGPVLNVLPLELGGGAFVAERFLTFPLTLGSLTLALLLADPPRLRPDLQRAAAAAGAVWLVAAAATVQLTVPHWQSNEALWRWGIRRAPRSAVPYTNLALEAVNAGRYLEGIRLAEEALRRDSEETNALNNKGLALFHLGRYEEAAQIFAELTQKAPENLLYWNNLAGALREMGKLQEAERILLDQVLARDPNFPMAHLNLGIVYLRADRPDLAAQHLQVAALLLPPPEGGEAARLLEQTREPERWLRLADLLLNHGDPQGAMNALDQAEQLGASVVEVALRRGTVLIALGRLDDAQRILSSLVAAGLEDPRLFNSLGLLARAQGDDEAARQYFQRALEMAPDWEVPRKNLEALGEP